VSGKWLATFLELLARIIHRDSTRGKPSRAKATGLWLAAAGGPNLVRKRLGEIQTSRQAPNTALEQVVPMPSLFRACPSMTQCYLFHSEHE
jgi:hypothetical protein